MSKSIASQVAAHTGTRARDWSHVDGPETGVGVEYWLRHKDGTEAYVVDDQGEVTISIGEDGDEALAVDKGF